MSSDTRFARRWWLAAVAALLMVLALGALPASAAAAGAGSAARFTAQAIHAGLTTRQAQALQARVDTYRAEVGGIQTAANEIRLPGGRLLLTLPGETTARPIGNSSPTTVTPACSFPNCCPYKHFCGYSHQNGQGDLFDKSVCNNQYEVPDSFNTYGSWVNNQTSGTVATFEDSWGVPIYLTPRAFSYDNSYDWHPVWYIEVCIS
jgi:hypothetical protein